MTSHYRTVLFKPAMVQHYIQGFAFGGLGKAKCAAECLQVEIKPDMVGHYLAEFSISYKPVKHGKPGIGATHSSRFIPLK